MTPCIITRQAPLSMGFSRQEYWSELPCPPPGDLPNPGIEPRSPALQADSLPSEPPGKTKVETYHSCLSKLSHWALRNKICCKTEKETQMYGTDFWTLWEKVRVG